MAKHYEAAIGLSADWRTPKHYFDALGLIFDCDIASPGLDQCWVPARQCFTKADDGLKQSLPPEWLIFMNPPFNDGGRNGVIPWLTKFFDHNNGIAIVRAYTSSGWFHDIVVPRAQLLCFPRGKTQFVAADGTVGKSPAHGIVIIAAGEVACAALLKSGLGCCCTIVEPGCVQLPLDWRERVA
jgi:hypothetical protein